MYFVAMADGFGFDDMTIGRIEQVQPTPEPATLLLMSFGIIGFAGYKLKKKKS